MSHAAWQFLLPHTYYNIPRQWCTLMSVCMGFGWGNPLVLWCRGFGAPGWTSCIIPPCIGLIVWPISITSSPHARFATQLILPPQHTNHTGWLCACCLLLHPHFPLACVALYVWRVPMHLVTPLLVAPEFLRHLSAV